MGDFMRISSKFMTGIVSKLATMTFRNKLGYEIDAKLNELFIVVEDDGRICVHLDAEARMTKEELKRILKNNGLD